MIERRFTNKGKMEKKVLNVRCVSCGDRGKIELKRGDKVPEKCVICNGHIVVIK